MSSLKKLLLASSFLIITGCIETDSDPIVEVSVEPDPVCVEQAKSFIEHCSADSLNSLSMDELYRCHIFETTPDVFLQRCSDISILNSASLFLLLMTDDANSAKSMKSSTHLAEIKKRCDNTPIKDFTLPEKSFCEESLNLNLLKFMDDIEEQLN